MPPPPSLVPVEELVFEVGGRTFHYDKLMVLDELTRCTDLNNRAVRVCRPSMPNEGHEGRVKVQFLVGGVFTFARPEKLFELTPERRGALSDSDRNDVALYEHTQKSCLGVDMAVGGRVYSTRS